MQIERMESMSKELEALERLKKNVDGEFNLQVIEDLDTIEQVLERNEPMKVITSEQGVHFCPNCHGSVWQIQYESNFCFRCGQKLDWEK